MHGHFLLQHFHHVAFFAFEVEQRALLVQDLAVGIRNPGGILDAIHRIADILAGRQTAILVLGQQALNRGIEGRVLRVDFSDLVLQRLLAPLLTGLNHPGVHPFHHGILGGHFMQRRRLRLGFLPAPLVGQIHDLLDFRVVALAVCHR